MSLSPPRRPGAFSLVELLVTAAVLAVLIGLIVQLLGSAQKATDLGHRHMDADEQALALFDRMANDIGQMVKRADVDYFLKNATQPQPGNDQLAFYSQVPGYYPGTGSQSPFSVVGYRVNNNASSPACNQLQRFGCGLLWSGYPAAVPPMLFLPETIAANWPAAVTMADDKDNYELAGPQVFRFEYYYALKGRAFPGGVTLASQLSGTPWDTRPGVDHTCVSGMGDVAALGVVIAVIDPKAQAWVKPEDLTHLAAALEDFDAVKHAAPGALETAWQEQVKAAGLPGRAISSIRIYRRWFYLSPSPLSNP